MNALLNRIPASAKMSAARSILAVSPEEETAVNTILGQTLGNPVVSAIIGRDFSTFDSVLNLLVAPPPEALPGGLGRLLGRLKNPEFSASMSNALAQVIAGSESGQMVASVLHKIVTSPIGAHVPDEFGSLAEMINEGLFPIITGRFSNAISNAEEETKAEMIVHCRFCNEIYLA